VYKGRVVSITKFGAFVNVLPGRDGLVHISKLGKGKRINNVEDVLQLGDEIEVRVDDIDDKGKISLTPTGEGYESAGGGDAPAREPRRERAPREDRRKSDDSSGDDAISVSFEDEFESELSEQLGDLGPGRESGRSRDGGNRDGGNRDGGNRRRHR
jgi:polyribonucleotide nucleotidyltransferase